MSRMDINEKILVRDLHKLDPSDIRRVGVVKLKDPGNITDAHLRWFVNQQIFHCLCPRHLLTVYVLPF